MTRSNSIPPAPSKRAFDELWRIVEMQGVKIAALEVALAEPASLGADFVTPKEYAHATGLTLSGVHGRLRKGTLSSIKKGGRRLIPRAEIK